jgi:hypothetical protein
MKRSVFKLSCALLLVFGGVVCSFAQETKRNDRPQADQTTQRGDLNKKPVDQTRYFYEFKQPEFSISHIVIEHDALGRGKISFERKGGQDPAVEPVEMSSTVLGRVLGLWTELRFLDSNQSYQASKTFAHLGTYTLGMDDGRRRRFAEFNWSNNPAAWTLTQEYRRVADQAIFVFEITVARENQPLNAPSVMNQLESLYRRNGLSDPRQLIPLLKELRTDEHIPLIARNQADRLLKKIEKSKS